LTPTILCKIAQLTQTLPVRAMTGSQSGFGYKTKVSNSDQLFSLAWAIIGLGDEHFFSLFQVL
jgi:hypothetical protein